MVAGSTNYNSYCLTSQIPDQTDTVLSHPEVEGPVLLRLQGVMDRKQPHSSKALEPENCYQ